MTSTRSAKLIVKQEIEDLPMELSTSFTTTVDMKPKLEVVHEHLDSELAQSTAPCRPVLGVSSSSKKSKRSPSKLANDIYIPVPEIDSDTYFHCCHFDCRFIYMTHVGLNNHLRKFHPDGDRSISGPRFDCPLTDCHQGYLTKKELRDHVETHTDAVVDEEDAARFDKMFPRRLRFVNRFLTIDESVQLWRNLKEEEKYDEEEPMYDVIRQVEEKLPEELVRINKMEKAIAAKERRAVKFLSNLEDPVEVERRNAERREEDEMKRIKNFYEKRWTFNINRRITRVTPSETATTSRSSCSRDSSSSMEGDESNGMKETQKLPVLHLALEPTIFRLKSSMLRLLRFYNFGVLIENNLRQRYRAKAAVMRKTSARRASKQTTDEKKLANARRSERRRQMKLKELALPEEEREKIYEHRRRVQREYVRKRVKTDEEKERLQKYRKNYSKARWLEKTLQREEEKLKREK